mmetsp:Transcript_30112/g.35774  ORF Transcript_30112/g.35774 Transcript_30112/m.35774 type:complete len:247 (+) Transcript_30112:139-879(+)
MRNKKVEVASATDIVHNNSKSKTKNKTKNKKRRWHPLRRGKTEERKVEIIVNEQYSYASVFSQSNIGHSHSLKTPSEESKVIEENTTSGSHHDRYDKNKLLKAESQMQKYIEELTNSIPESERTLPNLNSVTSSHKEVNMRKLKLTTSTGVLLFDGVDEDIPDDDSFKEIIAEERKSRKQGTGRTKFLVAPKDYDPIASGFYKPKCGEDRQYYESDEDDYTSAGQETKAGGGIEIILQDGRLSVLA